MKPSFQFEAQTGFWLTIQPTQVKNRQTDPKDRASWTTTVEVRPILLSGKDSKT